MPAQKVLVVDDEAPARERVKALIGKIDGFTAVAEASNGEQALQYNTEHAPDIVLLDIRMPGMDGLEVARHLATRTRPPAVVFCTAFDEHALAAFDAQAIGYLLKPLRLEQLEKVLQRAQQVNSGQLSSLAVPASGSAPEESAERNTAARRSVSVRHHTGYQLIALDRIRAFVADQKYVSVYYDGGEVLLDEALRDLEIEFADEFVRVHRNALVASAYITGMEKQGDAYALVLDGMALRPVVSRRHLSEVRKLLKSL